MGLLRTLVADIAAVTCVAAVVRLAAVPGVAAAAWSWRDEFRGRGGRRVFLDQTVDNANRAMRISGHLGIVRHQDHGDPLALSCWNISRISTLVFESRLPVGSSASSRSGSLINERAMATRCC